MQHTLTEQRKASSAVHGSFDEFELGNLALDLSLTPRQGQSCQHSGFVSIDTAYQPSKFRDLAQGDLFEPASLRALPLGGQPFA